MDLAIDRAAQAAGRDSSDRGASNRNASTARGANKARHAKPLYTQEQRARRDATVWTTVQAVLAPLQFLVFLVSLGLVVRFLITGAGHDAAVASIIVKTAFLLAIMATGAIWEREVFGQYLFAEPFFWEDVVSFGVIALHLAYVWALVAGYGDAAFQMSLALAAYAAYVVNAGQFLWKLRQARLGQARLDEEAELEGAAFSARTPSRGTVVS